MDVEEAASFVEAASSLSSAKIHLHLAPFNPFEQDLCTSLITSQFMDEMIEANALWHITKPDAADAVVVVDAVFCEKANKEIPQKVAFYWSKIITLSLLCCKK